MIKNLSNARLTILFAMVLGLLMGAHVNAACNAPGVVGPVTLTISGPPYVRAGKECTFELKMDPNTVDTSGGTWTWDYSGTGFTLVNDPGNGTITLMAPTTPSATIADKSISCEFSKNGWTGGTECSAKKGVTVYNIAFSASSWSPTLATGDLEVTYLVNGTIINVAPDDEMLQVLGKAQASVSPNQKEVREHVFPKWRPVIFQNVVSEGVPITQGYSQSGTTTHNPPAIPFFDPVGGYGTFSTVTGTSEEISDTDTPGFGARALWYPVTEPYDGTDTLQFAKREHGFVLWFGVKNLESGEMIYLKWFHWYIEMDLTFNVTGANSAGLNVNEWILEEAGSGDGVGDYVPINPPNPSEE